VLPSDGVTLGTICRLLTAYIRLAQRHEKKRNPPSRFKTCAPPIGSRSFKEDLERVYGTGRSPTVSAPAEESSPAAPGNPTPQNPEPPRSDWKPDVIAVPLGFSPEGLLTVHWDQVEPQ